MSVGFVSLGVLALAVVIAACGGGSTASSPTPAATQPAAGLDPSRSDAGIAARVEISNDSRNGLDGTHDIFGVADDGSECSGSFEEPEFIVVAWYDDAPPDTISRLGLTVGADDVPAADGTTSDIGDGAISFDFASETGFGATYTGASALENEGSSTIDVTRSGSTLTFDFEGLTYDNIGFAGQLICVNAGT